MSQFASVHLHILFSFVFFSLHFNSPKMMRVFGFVAAAAALISYGEPPCPSSTFGLALNAAL